MLYISAAMTRSRLCLLLGILLAAGCYSNSRDRRPSDDDDDAADDDDDTDDDDTGGTLDCEPEGVTSCLANTFVECSGGNWSEVETCSDDAPICDPDLGCLTCNPGRDTCDGNDVVACNDAGTAFTFVRTCEPGTTCLAGDCVDACDLARQRLSYLGCEFLASTTSNSLLSGTFDSDFGIAIGNPGENGGPAEITVMRGGAVVTTASVPPGTTAAITLPYVAELKNATESVTVVEGAYEITSTQPVAAYQYNPLHFDIGGTPSYTNDASLLLPEHTLTGSYMVGTWPTWGKGSWVDLFGSSGNWDTFYPGFVTVVGTADNTTVTFASNTTTSPGNPGALGPGGSTSMTLKPRRRRTDLLPSPGQPVRPGLLPEPRRHPDRHRDLPTHVDLLLRQLLLLPAGRPHRVHDPRRRPGRGLRGPHVHVHARQCVGLRSPGRDDVPHRDLGDARGHDGASTPVGVRSRRRDVPRGRPR